MRAVAALVALVAVGCGGTPAEPVEIPAHFPAAAIDRSERHLGFVVFIDDDGRAIYVDTAKVSDCDWAYLLTDPGTGGPFVGYTSECTTIRDQ